MPGTEKAGAERKAGNARPGNPGGVRPGARPRRNGTRRTLTRRNGIAAPEAENQAPTPPRHPRFQQDVERRFRLVGIYEIRRRHGMGTRRERQRQGQSDKKRPQDPEKDGHGRPAGRRQRQETEITVPEGNRTVPFRPFAHIHHETRLQIICNRVFIWQEMKEQNLSCIPSYISLLFFELNLSTLNSLQTTCIILPCAALG